MRKLLSKNISLTRFLLPVWAIGAIAGYIYWANGNGCSLKLSVLDSGQPHCVVLERADSDDERTKGLSARDFLGSEQGMLFVFEEPTSACMWMKDTRFPLDIIWLDDQKTIRRVAPNVSPETYPESFCQDNTKYVIEISAGLAERAELKVGQILNF